MTAWVERIGAVYECRLPYIVVPMSMLIFDI